MKKFAIEIVALFVTSTAARAVIVLSAPTGRFF